MFDPFIIVPGTLRNTVQGGETVGFELKARCGYYRRLILSMVEDLQVSVDGTQYPQSAVSLELRGTSYTFDTMETEYVQAWEFGEHATIRVAAAGGLDAGDHQVRLREQLRISYMPRPEIAENEQTERVEAIA